MVSVTSRSPNESILASLCSRAYRAEASFHTTSQRMPLTLLAIGSQPSVPVPTPSSTRTTLPLTFLGSGASESESESLSESESESESQSFDL